jgi:hypothetical protein
MDLRVLVRAKEMVFVYLTKVNMVLPMLTIVAGCGNLVLDPLSDLL